MCQPRHPNRGLVPLFPGDAIRDTEQKIEDLTNINRLEPNLKRIRGTRDCEVTD